MNNLSRRLFAIVRWTGLLAPLAVIGFLGGFTLHSTLVSAQAPQVRVTELQCSRDPESVTLTNQGTTPQDLGGWSLQSDPVASESYDLSPVGILAPGITVFIESGPSASGTFVWSQNFIFRDGDPTDFVRVVDNNGAVVHEVNCQGTSPSATATPTAAPTSAPTAAASPTVRAPASTPTLAPADVVPLGGGPPAPSSGVFAVILLAAGLLAIGVGVLTLPSRSPAAARVAVTGLVSRGRGPTRSSRSQAGGQFIYMVVLGVLAIVALLSRGRQRR